MTDRRPPANLMFSHMGISVRDIARMESFYTGVLGFTVTDRGHTAGLDLIFLSRDPADHHQIVLATGRPAALPANEVNPQFGPSINQISFKVATIGDLRDIHARLLEWGAESIFPANHGIAWSIYAHDPEGNNLEFYVESEWYINQPLLDPLDLSKSDEELLALTKTMVENAEGYQPYSEWQKGIAPRMARYIAGGVHGSRAALD